MAESHLTNSESSKASRAPTDLPARIIGARILPEGAAQPVHDDKFRKYDDLYGYAARKLCARRSAKHCSGRQARALLIGAKRPVPAPPEHRQSRTLFSAVSRDHAKLGGDSARGCGTPLAATSPEFKASGRAIDGKHPQSARAELAQSTRLGRRYALRTDITRFYGGIYTHSIPWALHTKAVAKGNRTLALLGNKLDYWVRLGQDQQTVGIPIGPDTSLLIAELIMQRCDQALLAKMSAVKGHRFIDDYELSFQTRTEAEEAFHLLQSCLTDYELTLNEKKTTVLELPLPLEAPWATELRLLRFRTSQKGQASDLTNYFSRAYDLHLKNPDEAVFQFAIARLRSENVHPKNWGLFQKLLLLCVAPEPACFPYVLEQIISRKNKGAAGLLAEWEEITNTLVEEHSSLKYSSEVANAAWACLALDLHLHSAAVDKISACDDSVVALLALDCEQKGRLSKPLDKTLWTSHMTQEALYDDRWLLAYEANIKGWLPSLQPGDHVSADPNFAFLKAQGVHFYDPLRAAPPPPAPVPLPALPTLTPTTEEWY